MIPDGRGWKGDRAALGLPSPSSADPSTAGPDPHHHCSRQLRPFASPTHAIPHPVSMVFLCGQLLLIPTHPLLGSSDTSSGTPSLTSPGPLAPDCLLPLLCQHIHHIVTGGFICPLSWQSPSIMPAIQWMRKWSTCCVRHGGNSNWELDGPRPNSCLRKPPIVDEVCADRLSHLRSVD